MSLSSFQSSLPLSLCFLLFCLPLFLDLCLCICVSVSLYLLSQSVFSHTFCIFMSLSSVSLYLRASLSLSLGFRIYVSAPSLCPSVCLPLSLALPVSVFLYLCLYLSGSVSLHLWLCLSLIFPPSLSCPKSALPPRLHGCWRPCGRETYLSPLAGSFMVPACRPALHSANAPPPLQANGELHTDTHGPGTLASCRPSQGTSLLAHGTGHLCG